MWELIKLDAKQYWIEPSKAEQIENVLCLWFKCWSP